MSDICSVTFDGASANLAMVAKLGAYMKSVDVEHLTNQETVVVMPNGCHVLKLARNTVGECTVLAGNRKRLEWKFMQLLVDYQDKEKLHLGAKIRQRHVAARTLSTRSAIALIYMEKNYPDDF